MKNLTEEKTIIKVVNALKAHNINVIIAEKITDVKNLVEGLLEIGSEVMTMSSVTLEETGVADLVNNSGKYISIKNILRGKDRPELSKKEKTRMASVPDYALGSVHALTENGELLIASQSGSQIPAYSYGPGKVIFVVGIQKIVKDIDAGIKRIYDYVLPLESERAKKAYGKGSNVNKLLIINNETVENRITLILVKESIGF